MKLKNKETTPKCWIKAEVTKGKTKHDKAFRELRAWCQKYNVTLNDGEKCIVFTFIYMDSDPVEINRYKLSWFSKDTKSFYQSEEFVFEEEK